MEATRQQEAFAQNKAAVYETVRVSIADDGVAAIVCGRWHPNGVTFMPVREFRVDEDGNVLVDAGGNVL